jgi:hypothetical protein
MGVSGSRINDVDRHMMAKHIASLRNPKSMSVVARLEDFAAKVRCYRWLFA